MKWAGITIKGPDAAYYMLASKQAKLEPIKVMLPTGTYIPGVRDYILGYLRSTLRFLFPYRICIKRK